MQGQRGDAVRLSESAATGAWRRQSGALAGRRPSATGAKRGARAAHPGSGGMALGRAGELGMKVLGGAVSHGMAAPMPIWLAALTASRCQATRNGEDHAVRWSCVSGRAVYTNAGAEIETIQPLGVSLQGGQTLEVYWMPGETGYSMEVYS